MSAKPELKQASMSQFVANKKGGPPPAGQKKISSFFSPKPAAAGAICSQAGSSRDSFSLSCCSRLISAMHLFSIIRCSCNLSF